MVSVQRLGDCVPSRTASRLLKPMAEEKNRPTELL